MHFRFYKLRFSFIARERLYFPPGKSSNILRGGFGIIFRGLCCDAACPGAAQCESRETCAYARICEPAALGTGPSGFADLPRPFVFRAGHLDGLRVTPGDRFHFDLHVFDTKADSIPYFIRSFAELGEQGLGPGRGKAELVETSNAKLVELNLAPLTEPLDRVLVRFVSPTELKGGSGLIDRPDFAVLACRIRDRISKLRELYGEGALDLDFRAFGERAAAIRMVRCDVRHVDVERRSSRTSQTHSIGGFVGEAEYEGDLREFIPFLEAARWTGVGRQTVWGKGALELRY